MKAVSQLFILLCTLSIGLTTCMKPSENWDRVKLRELKDYGQQIGTTSFILLTDGKVVSSWGDLRTPTKIHSVRKAVLSALVGQHIGSGLHQISPDATLEELGIDDFPDPLSDLQKQVSVTHLLKSVSGVNHTASAETPGMTRSKTATLGTEENTPGEIWAYNNWDYNVLTTILEQETGLSVREAFETGLVNQIGLQDFSDEFVFYVRDSSLSTHAKVGFAMSARDMARFGQLYLQKGKWEGKQVIPEDWIGKITSDFSYAGQGMGSAHGYLWWVPNDLQSKLMGIPEGTFYASGYGGQRIVVIPAWNSVVVHKVDTWVYDKGYIRYLGILGIDPDTITNHDPYFFRFMDLINTPDPASLEDRRMRKLCKKYSFVDGGEFQQFFQLLIDSRTGTNKSAIGTPGSELSGEIQIPSSTFSNVSCIQACLDYMNYSYSESFVYGSLGYAFLMHINPGLDPVQLGIWNDGAIYENASYLGVEIQTISARNTSSDFEIKQQEAWNQIRKAIDGDFPAYGFNLLFPSSYVITGYDDKGYYFRGPDDTESIGPKDWRRVGRNQIGWMEFQIFSPGEQRTDQELLQKVFSFTLKHAESPRVWIFGENRSGLKGYDLWISALSKDQIDPYGMAYYADTWSAMRRHAVQFLEEIRRDHPENKLVSDDLISYYRQVQENLQLLTELFPISASRHTLQAYMGDGLKVQEATRILKEARRLEALALEEMKKNLQSV